MSEIEKRIADLHTLASIEGYDLKGFYPRKSKLVFDKKGVLIVINLVNNNAVITVNNKKLKRVDLTDNQIKMIFEDPMKQIEGVIEYFI